MSSVRPNSSERFVVLAAVDDSTAAERVMRTSTNFTRMIAGAELHLVHVIEQLPVGVPPLAQGAMAFSATQVLEQARLRIDGLADAARAQGAPRVVTHVAVGPAWREIVQLAIDLSADLIFVGTHGRTGFRRLMLGSVAELVVRKAMCPVLVVRDKDLSQLPPEIEPPCVDCQKAQRDSSGRVLWCERHATKHPCGHLHYESLQSFGEGSQLLRP